MLLQVELGTRMTEFSKLFQMLGPLGALLQRS